MLSRKCETARYENEWIWFDDGINERIEIVAFMFHMFCFINNYCSVDCALTHRSRLRTGALEMT